MQQRPLTDDATNTVILGTGTLVFELGLGIEKHERFLGWRPDLRVLDDTFPCAAACGHTTTTTAAGLCCGEGVVFGVILFFGVFFVRHTHTRDHSRGYVETTQGNPMFEVISYRRVTAHVLLTHIERTTCFVRVHSFCFVIFVFGVL